MEGVRFNNRVVVAEFNRGPRLEGGGFAGGYVDIIRQFSDQLNDIQYSNIVPNDIDFNNLKNIRDINTTPVKPRDMSIEKWHIKPDGCIYQGNTEHSSRVVRFNGNVCITASGSRYVLIGRDSQIKEVMNIIYSTYEDYPSYNYYDPFNPNTIPLLFAAEMIVYGKYSSIRDRILHNLRTKASGENTRWKFGTKNPFEYVDSIGRSCLSNP